jgi:DNA-binding NarL/FixJ family response regulator
VEYDQSNGQSAVTTWQRPFRLFWRRYVGDTFEMMKRDIGVGSASQSIEELPYAVPVQVLLIDGSSHDLPLLRNASKWDSLEPFQITRKRTLAEGLEALQNSVFRIVLLDLSVSTLPEIESLTEVLGMAKGLPVIVLINEGGGVMNASEAMRRGAQNYLLRGCESDSLLQSLKHTMERQYLMATIEDGKESIARESHELRNALACIHEFGNILLDGLAGPISEDQREYVGIMLQNASRVRVIVENLRDPDEFMSESIPSPSGAN